MTDTSVLPPDLQAAMRARDEAFYAADAVQWGQYTAGHFTTVQQNGQYMSRAQRIGNLQAQKPRPYVAREREQHEQQGELVVTRFFSGGLWVVEVWKRVDGAWATVMTQATTAASNPSGRWHSRKVAPPTEPPVATMSHRCFRFKPSHPDLSAPQIAAIRRISPHSFAEIRRRAVANKSVLDIPVFSGEWPASKAQVVALLQGIEVGVLPLAVFDAAMSAGTPAQDSSSEQPLSLAQARQRLQFLRDIALEQDMHAQLEAGHIASPAEYTPLPEDEA